MIYCFVNWFPSLKVWMLPVLREILPRNHFYRGVIGCFMNMGVENEYNIILRLFLIPIIINNTAANILRAESWHIPLADASIFPQNESS